MKGFSVASILAPSLYYPAQHPLYYHPHHPLTLLPPSPPLHSTTTFSPPLHSTFTLTTSITLLSHSFQSDASLEQFLYRVLECGGECSPAAAATIVLLCHNIKPELRTWWVTRASNNLDRFDPFSKSPNYWNRIT